MIISIARHHVENDQNNYPFNFISYSWKILYVL